MEILLYAPDGRNGEVLKKRLTCADVACRLCTSEEGFLARLEKGADVILLTQKAWTRRVAESVKSFNDLQSTWSSPPLLMLTDRAKPRLEPSGAYLLQKPVPFATLLAAVRLALDARERQLEVGALITRLQVHNVDLKGEVAARGASLEASELRFEKAFRASPAPTVLIERSSGKVLDANPSFTALIDYAKDEVLNTTLEKLDILMSKWPWKRGFASDIRGNERFEVRLRTKSGEVRYCLLNAETISAEDRDCLLMTLVDITERKQNEEHLLHAIEEVMQDASWFSRAVVEKVGQLKGETLSQESAAQLTRREEQVLGLIGQGLANKAIAAKLDLSPNTVRNYIKNLYDKIGTSSRAEAIIWARERGITFVDA